MTPVTAPRTSCTAVAVLRQSVYWRKCEIRNAAHDCKAAVLTVQLFGFQLRLKQGLFKAFVN